MDKRYVMLYCDNARCAVNTFEYFDDGKCPGCGRFGKVLD